MKTKLLMPLIAVAMLLSVGCTSTQQKNAEAYATMAKAQAELVKANPIQPTAKITQYPDGRTEFTFTDSRVAEAQAAASKVAMPESTGTALVKEIGGTVRHAISAVGGNAGVIAAGVVAKAAIDKQVSNVSTVSTNTNTTTSGDTMGDNANNSGTLQTGDGRINSNDSTATPTVVTQPAPVIVQPQVVEPTVIQTQQPPTP